MTKTRSSIRKATAADLSDIYQWLHEESQRDVHGNFLCNWNLTVIAYNEGHLIAYFDASSGMAIAYQWGRLLSPGILQVKEDFRGKGVGRKIVNKLVNEAIKKNEPILRIECTPSTSIPFWERLGFTLCDNGVDAFRIIHKDFDLPDDSEIFDIVIKLYPESVKWDTEAGFLEEHILIGCRVSENTIALARRVSFYADQYSEIRDPVVEVIVSGECIYFDKAKYKGAIDIGIKGCHNGFYFDHIFIKDNVWGRIK